MQDGLGTMPLHPTHIVEEKSVKLPQLSFVFMFVSVQTTNSMPSHCHTGVSSHIAKTCIGWLILHF